MNQPQQLKKTVGIFGALALGLGSMVGTGVYIGIATAYSTSGAWVLLAIFAAAILALCNGMSSAQLASAHPVAGGTYEYGYKFTNPILGFSAGWLFESAKSASAATAALGIAGYLLLALGIAEIDLIWRIFIAEGILIVLGVAALTGLKRATWINFAILVPAIGALVFFVTAASWYYFTKDHPTTIEPEATRHFAIELWQSRPAGIHHENSTDQVFGILEACALMFVAYTGYGRVATLGEEIKDPRKNIPRAVLVTISVTFLIYFAVGLGIVLSADHVYDFNYSAPLEDLARQLFPITRIADTNLAGIIISAGAAIAMVGVLFNLILGLSRVWLAMGRRGDLPVVFQKLNKERTVPGPAVFLTLIVIAGLIVLGDVKLTWSFSAFTVLLYYALTNLNCLAMPKEKRFLGAIPSYLGLFGCVFLAFWIEPWIILAGTGWIMLGLIWFTLRTPARRKIAEATLVFDAPPDIQEQSEEEK